MKLWMGVKDISVVLKGGLSTPGDPQASLTSKRKKKERLVRVGLLTQKVEGQESLRFAPAVSHPALLLQG